MPALQGVAAAFFDEYLRQVRFTGDVWAVPEGTPVFAGEPLLRVTAPVTEAQLIETALLSTILFQTSVASKAARIVDAAAGRAVIEFGGRRAHGTEAALYAARAACLAGVKPPLIWKLAFVLECPCLERWPIRGSWLSRMS